MYKHFFIATLLFSEGPAMAQSLNAHEHGVASLMLAQEGHEVSIELEGAADSFLGFEYQPVTEQEKQRLNRLVELLNRPERLFSLAGRCRVISSELELPFEPVVADSDHDHDAHADKHDHGSHSDIHVRYQLDCSGQDASSVTLSFFRELPYLEHLIIEAVSDRGIVATKYTGDGTLKW